MMLKTGQSTYSEIYDTRLKGWFNVSVVPLRDDDGHLIGSVHVARDITEKKRAWRTDRIMRDLGFQ